MMFLGRSQGFSSVKESRVEDPVTVMDINLLVLDMEFLRDLFWMIMDLALAGACIEVTRFYHDFDFFQMKNFIFHSHFKLIYIHIYL